MLQRTPPEPMPLHMEALYAAVRSGPAIAQPWPKAKRIRKAPAKNSRLSDRKWLLAHTQKPGPSLRATCKPIGFAIGVLSTWLREKYSGDNKKVAAAVRRYRRSVEAAK